MGKLLYELDGNLYINLTNRCTNRCKFCVRNGKDSYYGHNLRLEKEPTAEEVLHLFKAEYEGKRYNEVVFCGFGEPTFRIDEITTIGAYVRSKGYTVRLNTNGQGNLINGYDITDKLIGAIDKVNVSLNMPTAKEYDEMCHSVYKEKAFDALLSFAKECDKKGLKVTLSVVDCIGKEKVEEAKKLCEENGLTIKVRSYLKYT